MDLPEAVGWGDTPTLKLELDDIEPVRDDENKGLVPFAIWDPENDDPSGDYATQYSKLAQPVKVTLNPGDMLYLPAMWYVMPLSPLTLVLFYYVKMANPNDNNWAQVPQSIPVMLPRRGNLCGG